MTKDNSLEEGLELKLQFEKRGGIIPVIVQDYYSLRVLMLAYINEEALERTWNNRLATFYSTSKKQIWTKGLTSGDYLRVMRIEVDCDQDAVIYYVAKMGKGACHTKEQSGESRESCFYRKLISPKNLEFITKENIKNPQGEVIPC